MTVSALPQRALIVIDVQNEYFSGALPIEYPHPQHSLENIAIAMDRASATNIPVIVVQHTAPAESPLFAINSDGWQLHPVVASRPRALLLSKNRASAFTGTGLAHWLADHAINTLTVVGYMTHNCNLSTINHAWHNGIAVEYLSDASGSVPYQNQAGRVSAEEIHRVCCVVLQSNFAAVLTTQQWTACIESGTVPVRDSILRSNQRARGLLCDAAPCLDGNVV